MLSHAAAEATRAHQSFMLCLHALSSFQRTERPAFAGASRSWQPLPFHSDQPRRPSSGEPSEITTGLLSLSTPGLFGAFSATFVPDRCHQQAVSSTTPDCIQERDSLTREGGSLWRTADFAPPRPVALGAVKRTYGYYDRINARVKRGQSGRDTYPSFPCRSRRSDHQSLRSPSHAPSRR
jgi:hypothetical protein